MPLSSSYHDYGGVRHAGGYQRTTPAAATAATAGPVRSAVQPVSRGSLGLRPGYTAALHEQRQASAEPAREPSLVVLGTASVALHRERALVTSASPRAASPSVSQLQPALSSRVATKSPRLQQPHEAPFDGQSSMTSSRRQRRSAQPLPSQVNPSFHAAVAGNTRTVEPRSSTILKGPNASVARTVSEARPAAPTLSSSSFPSPVPLRPLSTSREADYVNLAHQRSFMGRFRCATPVVVRTAASSTPHERLVRKEEARHEEDKGTLEEGSQPGPSHVVADGGEAPGIADEEGETEGGGAHGGHEDGATATNGDGLADHRPHAGAAPLPGNSMLLRPRLGVSGAASSSVAGGSTVRRSGRARRPSSSALNGVLTGRPSASPSVAASSLPRRSVRTVATSAGLRRGGTGASVSVVGAAAAAGSGVPAANVAALANSGLHTSLWVATQDGGVEVRSLASPAQVLASLPRKDSRTVITALVEVCGNRVVAGNTDGSLRVFDACTLQEVGAQAPPAHTAAVTKLLYVDAAPSVPATAGQASGGHVKSESSPTCSLVLAASLDRTITVWQAATMTLLHRLKGNVRGVCALAATSTGGYAFSGSEEGTLRMWDVMRGLQWGVTRDERAQLGKRASEASVGSGSVPIRHSLRVKEYTDSSSSSSSGSQSDGDDSSKGGYARDYIGQHGTLYAARLASPRMHSAPLQHQQHPAQQQSRPPLAMRPSNGAPHAASSNRRALVSYGGVKLVPRASASLGRGALTLPQQRGNVAATGSRGSAGLAHTSSRSLPPTEDAFAPTDTAMTSSPLRDGDGILAGLGGGISPLRTTLDYDDDDAVKATDEVDAGVLDGGVSGPVLARNHRATKKKKKRSRKADGTSRETSRAQGSAGGGGADEGKARRKGNVSGTGKRKKIKRAKKSSPSPTSSSVARLPANALEQRLEMWLRLYGQRVLFSTTSYQITTRIAAAYDTTSGMNWPIECAHVEAITALAVVEDRLLVSGSSDATAKVFALPSGQFVRTLTSSRHMPLSGVLYDGGALRIYTGFSDGAVSVYDLTSPELPLMTQLQSPQTILSCAFAPLAVAPMQRFVLNAHVNVTAEDGSEETAAVTAVARFDKTTLAHGPSQTTSSYRVGQPSLRELNAAVSLQLLQQQLSASRMALSKRNSNGTLEERDLRGRRQCGLVMQEAHARCWSDRIFLRWQRWARRRAQVREFGRLADVRARCQVHQLLAQYMQRWVCVARQHTKAEAAEVLRGVQLQESDAKLLFVGREASLACRSRLDAMAVLMAGALRRLTVRNAYCRWRELQRIRHAELRQAVGFNTLLLSMNTSAYAPSRHTLTLLSRTALRRAYNAKATWLLTELAALWPAQQLRRHFFNQWRGFAQQRERVRARADEAWSVVEPLSSTLVQSHVLRRRYFEMWRDFAVHVARSGQLSSERETLQGEWNTLQRALLTPTTVDELKAKVRTAETGIAAATRERTALAERVQALADEDSTLRTEAALRVLIAGYYVPDVAATTSATVAATAAMPSAHAGASRMSLNARRTSAESSVESGSTGETTRVRMRPALSSVNISVGTAEEPVLSGEEMRDRKLLIEAGAVLRALKGNCMQSARDDKLLAKAHALALRLPVVEPLSYIAVNSTGSSPSYRSGMAQHPQRSTTWSVSSAKNGSSTAASERTSPATSQQRRRHSAQGCGTSTSGPVINPPGCGIPSSATVVGSSSISSGNPPRASAAQMWAAQPAEENYPSLADAFNAIYANVLSLLYNAAMECGVAGHVTGRSAATTGEARGRRSAAAVAAAADASPSRDGGEEREKEREDGEGLEELRAPAVAPSWLAQVPLKQRRVMVGEVLKLVTLFDSFAAHSDLPVERAGGISTRGAANTRALPLCSLCSSATAQSLLRHAAVLLELVDPQLWPRQLKLNYLQDAYSAAIAELNATVSSSHFNDTRQHSSTVMTHSESEDQDGSPLPTPLVMRPPALCLSADVLQRAADTLQAAARPSGTGILLSHQDTRPSPTMTSGSDGQATRSGAPKLFVASSGIAASHSTLPLINFGSFPAGRSDGSEDKLDGTLRSTEEEGQTSTPDRQHVPSTSFSHRSFSAVSTPRSYTPRTAASSVANTSTVTQKPYLGFRVNVTRDSPTARRAAPTIIIRDIAAQYVSADGIEAVGPALAAGLKAGDQLVRFAGYAVTDLAAFNAVVSRHVHSGAELPVVVQRGEELLSTTITVGTRLA